MMPPPPYQIVVAELGGPQQIARDLSALLKRRYARSTIHYWTRKGIPAHYEPAVQQLCKAKGLPPAPRSAFKFVGQAR